MIKTCNLGAEIILYFYITNREAGGFDRCNPPFEAYYRYLPIFLLQVKEYQEFAD